MTIPQAVKLAIGALRKEAQRLAFDANLAEKLGATAPEAVRASRDRRRILAAIETLGRMGRSSRCG